MLEILWDTNLSNNWVDYLGSDKKNSPKLFPNYQELLILP